MKKIPVLVILLLSSFLVTSQAISYADEVVGFSSQFSSNSWSASRAQGAPDVYPDYGDDSYAWASSGEDDMREYLELQYACPYPINEIWIYETYNPGAVDTLYVKNPNTDQWEMVWSGTAFEAPKQSRIFKATFDQTSFSVAKIRIAINSPAVSSWNEIDAVAIVNSDIGPDLVIQNIQGAPDSIDPFEELSLTYEVLNDGEVCSDEHSTVFYLSEDESLDFRDTELESVDASPLDPQETEAGIFAFTITPDIKPGTYNLIVAADGYEDILETNEENNASIASQLTINPVDADLVISSANLDSETAGPEQEVTLTIEVSNQGYTLAESNKMRVYLSEDDNLTLFDELVYDVSIDQLAGEESAEVMASFTVPLSYQPEEYHVFCVIDDMELVDEVDETNNTETLLLTYASSVDLVIENLTVDPSSITQDSDLSFTYDLVDLGNAGLTSTTKISFYLSEDEALDSGDQKYLDSEVSVGSDIAMLFSVPAGVIADDYNLIASIDPDNNIYESDESNNVSTASLTITQSDVDLQVSSLTINADDVQIGNSATANIEIDNVGTADASLTTYTVHLSTDETLDAEDAELVSASISSIGGVETVLVTPALSFENLSSSGTHYLIVSLDVNNSVEETDESNNTFSLEVDLLANDTDLTSEDAILSVSSIRQGEVVSISGSVVNSGSQLSQPFPLEIYLSIDETLDQEDELLFETSYDELDNGTSYDFDEELPIRPMTAEGDYHILLQIAEGSLDADATNNLVDLSLEITPSEVDLLPQNLSLNMTSVSPGEEVVVTGDIINTGSQSSVPSTLGIYLSTDEHLSFDDENLGNWTVGVLANSETEVIDYGVNIPFQTTSGTYHILVVSDVKFEIPESNDHTPQDLNGGNNVEALEITVTTTNVDLLPEVVNNKNEFVYGEFLDVTVSVDIDEEMYHGGLEELEVMVYFSEDDQLDDSDAFLSDTYLVEEYNWTLNLSDDDGMIVPAHLALGDYYLILEVDSKNEILESNEENNIASTPITIVSGDADLVAYELVLNVDRFYPNTRVNVEYAFQNIGTSQSTDGRFRLLLSENNVPDGFDIELRDWDFDGLEPQDYELNDLSFNIPSDALPGEYYIILDVDYAQKIPEANNANNISITPIAIEEPDVDLIFADFRLRKSEILVDEGVLVEFVVKNEGNTTSSSYAVGYYLSEDEVLDNQDRLNPLRLDSDRSGLEEGEETNAGTVIRVNEPGDYFVILEVDYRKAALESDETNNIATLPLRVLEDTQGADTEGVVIKIEEVVLGSSEILQGRDLAITATIGNEGDTKPSRPRMHFNLYRDEVGFDEVASLGSINLNNPDLGKTATTSGEFQINARPGEYYLIATIGNDRSVHPLTVTAPNIDLEILDVNIPNDGVYDPGQQINTRSYLFNNGNQTAYFSHSSYRLGVYLSYNDQLDSRDIKITNSPQIPDINPQEMLDMGGTFFIPEDQGAGNFYLIYKADDLDNVEESNEQNNTFSTQITIRDRKLDLELINPSLNRPTLVAGGVVDFRTTILNNGGGTYDEDFYVSFFLSHDDVLSNGDELISIREFDWIEIGESIPLSEGLVLPSDLSVQDYHLFAKVDAENMILEDDENNNVAYGGVVSISSIGEVDLTIENARLAPEIAKPNGSISILGSLVNSGSVAAHPGKISVFLSEDELLDEEDVQMDILGDDDDVIDLSLIHAGMAEDWEDDIFVGGPVAPGDWFALVQADPLNEIEESDESNNVIAIPLEIGEVNVDYDSESQLLSSSSVAAGEHVLSTIELINNGAERTETGFYIAYFLSQDEIIDETDISLLEAYDPMILWPGFSRERPDQLIFDLETTPGNYKVLARLDSRMETLETDETNNDLVLGDIEIISSDLDFLVSELNPYRTSFSAGDLVTIDYELRNDGSTTVSSVTTSFYVSSDATLDESDILLTRNTISSNGSVEEPTDFNFTEKSQSFTSETIDGQVELVIPVNLTPADYFIIASVDDESLVTESDETNNTLSQSITITAPDIDILLSELSFTPSEVVLTELVEFGGVMANVGTTVSTDFSIQVYASTDGSFDSNEDELVGEILVEDVGANGISKSFASERLSTSNLTVDSYTIFYVVDAAEELPETDETNNVFQAAGSLTTEAGVDLNVQSVDPIAELRIGGNINVSGSIENTGIIDAKPTRLDIFLSSDEVLDENDTNLFEETISDITAGNELSFTLETDLPVSVTAGSYKLILVVDALEEEPEVDEDNNQFLLAEDVIIHPGEDLVISSIGSLPTSLNLEETLEVTGEVSNIGTVASAATALAIYLSTDELLDANDILADEVTIDALVVDGVAPFTSQVSFDAEIAVNSYFVIAEIDYMEEVDEFDEDNNSLVSSGTFELTEAPLGLENQGLVAMYPNPAFDYLNIQSANKSSTEIYDLRGMLILHSDQRRIGVEGLARGSYLIIIKNESGEVIYRNRLIKQ